MSAPEFEDLFARREQLRVRSAQLREQIPNVPFQMLLRGSNAVGYTNYSDNVVRYFVQRAAARGIDVFRVFDSLNWVRNMRVAIDAVLESGALCEGAICYTADLFDAKRKYGLDYYLKLARELQAAGVHVLGIKDMAGVARPRAIRELVRVLKAETGLPVHFHTHDTSGIAAASVLAAVEAGVDAIDGALDAMSGLTSQPNLGAIVAALEGSERDPGLDRDGLRQLSDYWEGVRKFYQPFEADIRAGTADVYKHEMPGGQYTNLREQARAMGLEHRWAEVSQMYADVNQLFGDIVKVTPTSKVVGDMAIFLVANGLNTQDILDPSRDIAFPDSVIALFKGELGFPPDGFPADVSRRILKCGTPSQVLPEPPAPYRPGDSLAPVDLAAAREEAEKAVGRHIDDDELASYLMYPKVFRDYAAHQRQYGDVSVLPTRTFFYGLADREEIAFGIDAGKTLILSLQGSTPVDDDSAVQLFFELNGQARAMPVAKAGAKVVAQRAQADAENPNHVPAPMPGMVVTVGVKPGQSVKAGDPLVSIEAMKMESQIRAERDATIKAVHVKPGDTIAAHDLLIELG